MTALTWAGLAFITGGLFFFLGTVIGVHRFPDLYTRIHGASKGDTLSSMLVVFGLVLMTWEGLSSDGIVRASKLFFIIFFLSLASPAASHALVDAAFKRGIPYWRAPGDYRNPDSDSSALEARKEQET